MKKAFLVFICIVCTICLHAQNSINADGTIKHRANVAIIVTSRYFSFSSSETPKDYEDLKALKSTVYANLIHQFGMENFAVVNRDNDAYTDVMNLMEENKLEDYIDGFAVKAKGEGADCLFLCDITFAIDLFSFEVIYNCRFIDVETNQSYHYTVRSGQNSSGVQKFNSEFRKHLLKRYPEFYGVIKTDGKKWYILPYQPQGSIFATDKFYAFQFSKKTGKGFYYQFLDPIGVATEPHMENGYIAVKSDKSLDSLKDILLCKELEKPTLNGAGLMCTYFALDYDPKSYKGFITNRINNAVYDAITKHPFASLIEQEILPELKKERELQKTEDFINGHTVEQMKAIGAAYLFYLQDLKIVDNNVTFKLSVIDVSQNKTVRTADVMTSICNIEKEMYRQICERIGIPVHFVCFKNKKTLDITTCSTVVDGTKIIISVRKLIENPATGEKSYMRIDICKGTVFEYHNNRFLANVDNVLSKDDYKNLEQYMATNTVDVRIDGSDV